MSTEVLYLVKFRRSATPLERKQFSLDRVYDCTAFYYRPFAQEFINSLEDADDVEIIETTDASLNDLFLDRPDDEIEFYKTGKLKLIPMTEALGEGVSYETVHIDIYAKVHNESGEKVEYTAIIDDNTKNIVITPMSTGVSFVDIVDNKDGDDVEFITISVNAMSETDDFEVVADVDNIGQIIVSAVDDTTEFVSATVGEDLNLVTQDDPFNVDDCVTELTTITDNFTVEEGNLITHFKKEMEIAVSELDKHYKDVLVDARGEGNETVWEISYSTPIADETITEGSKTDTEDDDGNWVVEYTFGVTEALTEASDTPQTLTVRAKDADDAIKYAEQFARKMRRENPEGKWSTAKVSSIKREGIERDNDSTDEEQDPKEDNKPNSIDISKQIDTAKKSISVELTECS